MRKLLIIYNPNSGNRSFKNELDTCIKIFQEAEFLVTIFRTCIYGDIDQMLSKITKDEYHTIVVSGGDGSINIVVNCILKHDLKTKLGIIPAGTANDFCSHLKIPKDAEKAAQLIVNNRTMRCDVGLANDTYFINVFAAGLLTNISQRVDKDFKSILGKFAYYLKGIEQIPNFVPIPVKITNSNTSFIEDIYFFIILNSCGTGGFEKLAVDASIDDGLFDFVAIKACPIVDLALLFVKILKGEHLEEDQVIYFKDHYIHIENLSNDDMHNESDIDGEVGPDLPVEVRNVHKAIEIYY